MALNQENDGLHQIHCIRSDLRMYVMISSHRIIAVHWPALDLILIIQRNNVLFDPFLRSHTLS